MNGEIKGPEENDSGCTRTICALIARRGKKNSRSSCFDVAVNVRQFIAAAIPRDGVRARPLIYGSPESRKCILILREPSAQNIFFSALMTAACATRFVNFSTRLEMLRQNIHAGV